MRSSLRSSNPKQNSASVKECFRLKSYNSQKSIGKSKPVQVPNQQQTQYYDKVTKLESKILDRVSLLKKNKKHIECRHLERVQSVCEEYNPQVNYYDKFWKTFLINQISNVRITQMEDYVEQYEEKLFEIQELFDKHQELTGLHGKKKSRRHADEIEKQYQCPYPKCYKNYGSDVSLNLHIKLKHNGGNKTDREKAAELIWQAKQRQKPIPQFYINLPPNFIEEYGKMTNRIKNNQQEQFYDQENQ